MALVRAAPLRPHAPANLGVDICVGQPGAVDRVDKSTDTTDNANHPLDFRSRVFSSMWDIIRGPVGDIRWGSTIDNTLGRIGRAAHESLGDRAHQTGLGPHAVADNIISLFGEESAERSRNLAAVQIALNIRKENPPTTEQPDEAEEGTAKRIDLSALRAQCSRFVKYTLSRETVDMQCAAFQRLVQITTMFPGLRLMLLVSKHIESCKLTKFEDKISKLWNRPGSSSLPDAAEWWFWRSFAQKCLSDEPISLTIERCHITQVVQHQLGTSSCVIEELLRTHRGYDEDTEESSALRALCIRYLGQIIALDEFWDQVKALDPPTMSPHITVQTLCVTIKKTLEDLQPRSCGPNQTPAFDYEGVDILAFNLLDGVARVLQFVCNLDLVGRWRRSCCTVLRRLQRDWCRIYLPNSYDLAHSECLTTWMTGETEIRGTASGRTEEQGSILTNTDTDEAISSERQGPTSTETQVPVTTVVVPSEAQGYVKAIDSHPSHPLSMPQRWFLLSIAINQYQSSKIRNLAGCLNDAELLRSCLCSLLGTPSESAILSLTDAEATRAAIISAFFTHLIENPEIRVGDPIIIFYSGQGGMPSLCPADWQQDVIPAIPDVTMNALLRLLARYKGSNITFICDSCYYREVRNPSRLPDIDLAILKRAHRDGTEFPFRDGSHILLAACSVNETAHRERLKPSGTSSSDGQYPCGVFTKALTERLSVLRSQSIWQHVTYSQLMASLTLKDQNPRCSGYYQNCLLFRDRRESAPCFFRLLPATDTYRAAVEDMFHLDAGLAHGISVGTKINVYRKVSASECLGVLEVCTIRPLSATARRVSGDHLFDVPAPCWAGIRTWAAGDLRVYASSSVAKSISLPNSQSAFNLLRADDKESSHISLHLKPDGYITIERQDPLMKSFSCHSVTSQLTVGLSLPDALQRIAHFYFHLGRRISEALLDSNDLTMSDKVSLCMNHVVQDNDGFPECGPPVTFSKNTFYLVGDKPPSNSYSLTISNLSDHAFYVYLFSMDPTDYSIIPLYFPQSPSITPPLGPRNSFTIGDPYIGQGWEEAIKFTGDDGKFLKLILCNRWIDLTYIAQPSVLTTIVGTLPPRPDGRDRMEAEFATVRADEFFEGGRQITPPDRSFFKLAVGSLKANLKQITQSSVERATAEGTLLCSPSPGGPLGAHMNRDMIQCIQCLMGLTFRKRRSLRLLHRHGRVYREHS